MGGLIGAAYAVGLSAADIETEALHILRPRHLVRLIDLAPARYGLLSGQSVHHYLREVLGADRTFADLRIPLGLTSVDLISGKMIALTTGSVVDAVRATIALPAIFEPVHVENYRLVDGGVLDHLPVDVARRLGAETVIAIDVSLDFYDLKRMDDPKTPAAARIAHSAWRSESLTVGALVAYQLRETRPEVLIHPSISAEVTVFNGLTRAAEIIAAGEQAATEALTSILTAVRPALRWPRFGVGMRG